MNIINHVTSALKIFWQKKTFAMASLRIVFLLLVILLPLANEWYIQRGVVPGWIPYPIRCDAVIETIPNDSVEMCPESADQRVDCPQLNAMGSLSNTTSTCYSIFQDKFWDALKQGTIEWQAVFPIANPELNTKQKGVVPPFPVYYNPGMPPS